MLIVRHLALRRPSVGTLVAMVTITKVHVSGHVALIGQSFADGADERFGPSALAAVRQRSDNEADPRRFDERLTNFGFSSTLTRSTLTNLRHNSERSERMRMSFLRCRRPKYQSGRMPLSATVK